MGQTDAEVEATESAADADAVPASKQDAGKKAPAAKKSKAVKKGKKPAADKAVAEVPPTFNDGDGSSSSHKGGTKALVALVAVLLIAVWAWAATSWAPAASAPRAW